MDELGEGKTKAVTARLSTTEYSTLVKVAKGAELPVAELARILIEFGMARLAAGDADLQRAVKGSRDAALR
jgi:hypothetical protein